MSGSIPPYNPNFPGYSFYGTEDLDDEMETGDVETDIEPEEVDENEEVEEEYEDQEELDRVRRDFWIRIRDLKQGGNMLEMVQFAKDNKSVLQGEVTLDPFLEKELVKAEKPNEFLQIGRCAIIDTMINDGTEFPLLVEALCNFMTGSERNAYVILRGLGTPVAKIDSIIQKYSEDYPRLARHFTNLKNSYLRSKAMMKGDFDLNRLRA